MSIRCSVLSFSVIIKERKKNRICSFLIYARVSVAVVQYFWSYNQKMSNLFDVLRFTFPYHFEVKNVC